MATTNTTPAATVTQDEAGTIPALVVYDFFNKFTPLNDKLAELSAFAQLQYNAYAAKGVGQPLLGPYEALGKGFSETNAFKTAYGALNAKDFIATAYNQVFSHAPSDAQAAHFQAQIDYFVSIYSKAGVGADAALLGAKGAVLGQMLGHAVIDGGAGVNYLASAQAYIAAMSTNGFEPGKPLSNFDPDNAGGTGGTGGAGGGGGGGGGGGPAGPAPIGASVVSNVLTLTANDIYSFTFNASGDLTISRLGTTETTLLTAANVDALTQIIIQSANGVAKIDGAHIGDLKTVAVSGAGKLDVTGVSFSGSAPFTAPDLSKLAFASVPADGFLPANLLVNGTVKDAFAAVWVGLDSKYYAGPTFGAVATNEAFVKIANDYVNYLNAHNDPIDTVFQTRGGTPANPREQSLHNNILGNITDSGVQDRINFYNADPTHSTGYPADVRTIAAKEFGTRPWADGYTNNSSDEHAALAWDYSRGLKHDNYVDHSSNATVDANGQLATPGGNFLWFNYNGGAGSGNTINGFNVGRHEGAGIEIALKAKARGGGDYTPTLDADGVTTHYHVNIGADASNANRAKWNFDFSVLTGLNGRTETLNDYDFKMFIDKDKSSSVSYQELKLNVLSPGSTPWTDPSGQLTGFVGDDDGPGAARSQNSVNFGFDFLRSIIDNDVATAGVQPYAFGVGEFDIKIEAYKKGDSVPLVGTHIVVHVDM